MDPIALNLTGAINLSSDVNSSIAINITSAILTLQNSTKYISAIDTCKTVFYCILAVVIAVTNLLTIIAVYKFKYLHTPTYTFVLSLSVADILLFPPLAGLRFIKFINDGVTVQVLNAILLSLLCLSLNMSFMSLLAVALDRHKAVLRPYDYKATMNVRKAKIYVMIMWAYGVITMVPVVIYYTFQRDAAYLRECQEISKILPTVWYMILVAAQTVVYVIISIVIYIRVFLELGHRAHLRMTLKGVCGENQKPKHSKETRRITKMMAIVLGSIFCTWLPYTIVSTISTFMGSKTSIAMHTASTLTLLILYSNSFLNPLIYAWRSPQFRKAYASLLSCGRFDLNTTRASQEISSGD